MSKFEKETLNTLIMLLQNPDIKISMQTPEPEKVLYIIKSKTGDVIFKISNAMQRGKDVFTLQINGKTQDWEQKNLEKLYTKVCTAHIQLEAAKEQQKEKGPDLTVLKTLTEFLQDPEVKIELHTPTPEVCVYVVKAKGGKKVIELTSSMKRGEDIFSIKVYGEPKELDQKKLKSIYTKICTAHIQKTSIKEEKTEEQNITDFLSKFKDESQNA